MWLTDQINRTCSDTQRNESVENKKYKNYGGVKTFIILINVKEISSLQIIVPL
jgi:hypothetical protein